MKRLILLVTLTGAVLLGTAALLDSRRSLADVETMAMSAPAPSDTEQGFVLSEYGGRVAVYSSGAATAPKQITSIWVYFLPSADRADLKTGITAANETDLAALLEDLNS